MRNHRSLTAAIGVVLAAFLSGCIFFPPFWPPTTDPFATGGGIVVENTTNVDWVVELSGDFPIAFAVGAGQIGSAALFGSVPDEVVLRDPDCAEADRLAWDGSAAAVRIDDPGTLTALDAAPTDDAGALVEYWECQAASTPPMAVEPLADPGGRMLVTSQEGAAFVLDVAEASVALIGQEPEPGSISFDGEHEWSPDGSRLAFSRSGAGGDTDGIYVAKADGSDEELLAPMGAAPRWSPDGERLAFISTDPFAGGSSLAVVELATGTVTEVAPDAMMASWSPDGDRLAYVTTTDFMDPTPPPADLRIVNADGAGSETLAEAAPYSSPPRWSPDGTRIAFSALAQRGGSDAFGGETVASVHDLRSGETTVLASVEDGSVGEPTWSPDGSSLAVTIQTAGLFRGAGSIGLVDAESGVLITLEEEADTFYSYPVWSPDGEWLAVTRTAPSDIVASLLAVRLDGSEAVTLATNLLAATQWLAGAAD